MFDAYIDSNLTTALSFTIFELSDKGELIIDKQQRELESHAAFIQFVNPKTGWIFAVKNTLENQKKLLTNQPIQNFKVKIVNYSSISIEAPASSFAAISIRVYVI